MKTLSDGQAVASESAGARFHPSWEMIAGLAILLPIITLGIVIPLLSPFDPEVGISIPLMSPSLAHLFGTDQLGRDVFVRVFAAARLDLFLALVGVAVPMLIGTVIGAAAAMTDNRVLEFSWTLVVDAINAFPFFVLVMAVVSIVGQGVEGLLVALAATNWARYARITRSRAAVVRSLEYIQATRVLGYSRPRTILRHVLPNVADESLAYALSDVAIVIVTIAGLTFLGLGVRPPTPEWGGMMADGRLFIETKPWLVLFPGAFLALTAVGVALVAEGARRGRSS